MAECGLQISAVVDERVDAFLKPLLQYIDRDRVDIPQMQRELNGHSFDASSLHKDERLSAIILIIRKIEAAALQRAGAETRRVLQRQPFQKLAFGLDRNLVEIMPTSLRGSRALVLELIRTVVDSGLSEAAHLQYVATRVVSYARSNADEYLADPEVNAALEGLRDSLGAGFEPKGPRYVLAQLLVPPGTPPIKPDETWTNAVIDHIDRLQPEARMRWVRLLDHCANASASKPSARWTNQASELVREISDDVASLLVEWFRYAEVPSPVVVAQDATHSERMDGSLARIVNADVLKGLCWVASNLRSDEIARALGSLSVSCYKKVPGIGPRLVKVGNAAVYALGQIPGEASLGQLAMLRIKIKFGSAQKMLEKALDAAAEREGIPRDEIEEMAVPAYWMMDVGEVDEPLGEHVAQLRVTGTSGASATTITWRHSSGKVTKSVPAAVKQDFADELKEFKATAKDIQKMLPAQVQRIDAMFLDRKSWDLPTWRQRYLNHPLVGTIARRLIWLFSCAGETVAVAWLADDPAAAPHGPGHLVRANGEHFLPDAKGTTVRLWHPINEDMKQGAVQTRDDVLAWRKFYESREIRQPFKQAHREVYLLTDAERNTETYSNRFAAHILRQHQLNALAAQRGWKAQLRLMVDAEYPPLTRMLNAWGIRAEFWVEGIGDDYVPEYVLESSAFRFVSTDQVRFYDAKAAHTTSHAGGGPYRIWGAEDQEVNHPLQLDTVPPIVLSEVLRDVDLFVGVASVGNNPAWNDGGPDGHFAEYWYTYSFGDLSETANTRREILERLIPRLKIASACTVTDKFLVVLGKKRTYKIHLGSGNILMEPNDQYLCIVPNASMESGPKGSLFLPFEGDRVLAVILSKAFLLAEDDKIKDRTILSQIDSTN